MTMVDDPKKNDAEETEEEESSEEESSDESEAKSAPDEEEASHSSDEEEEHEDEEHEHEEHEEHEPPGKKRVALYLAEYDSSAQILHAAEKIRKAGYTKWDTHTPFPVHGMDGAMGLKDSPVGWIVFFSGLTGVSGALLMMWWMGGVDYPLVVGGKPGFTLPSSVPIMFELMVLLSAFGAIFGMLHLNKLPRHHHPVFESDRFRAASDDKFFISIEAEDPKFDVERTKSVLEGTHPSSVELVEEFVPEEEKKEAH
jgi:hypothetical protein